MKVDLLAVGGGFAGLVAANRAAELGLSAAVIERGSAEDYICNSRVSTGVLHCGLWSVEEPPDVLYDRIMDITDGEARPDLARCFAGNTRRAFDWLETHGASFVRNPGVNYGLFQIAPPRRMTAGLDWPESGPHRLLQSLTARLESAGGAILRGTEALDLVIENDACTGVEARGPEGDLHIETNAVTIADGGFQADPERLRRHITGRPDRIRQRNTQTGCGDGARMAERAGAALVGLDKFYGHLLSRDAMTDEGLWPYPQVDVICTRSIVVDGMARRFTDEGIGGIWIANAIAALDDPLSATAVFDETVWDHARDSDLVPPNPTLVEAGGTVHGAGSIETLAGLAGLDPGALAAAVAGFNAAVRGGKLETLNPPRRDGGFDPAPIETPPFRAIPLAAGITVTMGGIAIDGAARVLRPDDTPIAGLYAAGSTAGGMEGGPRAGYVGGLIKAFLLGLVAAESAATAR